MRKPFNGSYPVTRPFGVYDPAYINYPDSRHPGTDYGTPNNHPLVASISGTVKVIDRGTAKTGRGKEVNITNGNTTVKYCHLNAFSVVDGTKVVEGQEVGLCGYTGYVVDSNGNIGTKEGAHLHYEVLINGIYVNPEGAISMAEKVSLSTARILAETILGRDRDYTHAGKGDADLNKNHVGKDLTNDYIMNLWTSKEAKAYAAQKAKDKVALATQTKRAEVAEKSLAEANKEIDRLKAQLAIQSDDTQLLNGFGETLRKLIIRLGLKG